MCVAFEIFFLQCKKGKKSVLLSLLRLYKEDLELKSNSFLLTRPMLICAVIFILLLLLVWKPQDIK